MVDSNANSSWHGIRQKNGVGNNSIIYAFLIFLLFFYYSGGCMAEHLEYCYDHPLGKLDWTDNATLPKFDPSLGKLTGIKIVMNLALFYNYSLLNVGDYAANTSIDFGGSLAMELSDKKTLTVDAHGTKTIPLGLKEAVSSSDSCNQSQSFNLDEFDWLMGSSSGETVILPLVVTTQSSVHMGGDIKIDLKPQGAASVCIAYEYAPAKGV
jgi:hypothetical protein